MPPVTGTEVLGTPVLKNGQRNNTSIPPIPPVTPKAAQKFSEEKKDLHDYFRKVDPTAKASPKIQEDKNNLYGYFKKVQSATKAFEPLHECTQSLGKQNEITEVEFEVGDLNQKCKKSKLTRKRKHKDMKSGAVYDQNKNATNVLVALKNSGGNVCEYDQGKAGVKSVTSDVNDFEDEIEMPCDTNEVQRDAIKASADEKKSKPTKLENKGFLLKKKCEPPLAKKENHPVIQKNVERQNIDKTINGKVPVTSKGSAKTLDSGKKEKKNSSVDKEYKNTFNKVGNENIIMPQEKAQNKDLAYQNKNGKALGVKLVKKSGSEDTKSGTCKENGSLNKTNAFAFMMATRHKQDEAIEQMRHENAQSSGDDDLEILEHKKTVESPRSSSSGVVDKNEKKELKKGTNAFDLLMIKRQTPKKVEEAARVTEVTILDSDNEDGAQQVSSTKQGDNKGNQKRKAKDMNDSLHDFELEGERKKKALKNAKKSIGGNNASGKSKGILKSKTKSEATDSLGNRKIQTPSNTKPETLDSLRDGKTLIHETDMECKTNQVHTNSTDVCGPRGDLEGVKVISFQDYMASCKELLLSQSYGDTTDFKDVSGKSNIDKPSHSIADDLNNCESQGMGYQNTDDKMQHSKSGNSVEAKTGSYEKVRTGFSENADLSKSVKTCLSKKFKTVSSKNVVTDLSEKSKTGPSKKVKTSLSKKSETGPLKKVTTGFAKEDNAGQSKKEKTGPTETKETSLFENAKGSNSEKDLTMDSEKVTFKTSDKTEALPEKNEIDPPEKTETSQEKISNPKVKSISSFFRKITKEESLQERSKITIVADVHATAEGSSTSISRPVGQAKGTKAKEPYAQDASSSNLEEDKDGKNNVETVTPRRNARRKTRSVQEELEKIELLDQVAITEEDASSQDKKAELLANSASCFSIALNADQNESSLNISKVGKSCAVSLDENSTEEGNSSIISKFQDCEVTSKKMTKYPGVLKEEILEKTVPEALKQTPSRKAQQTARDESVLKLGKEPEKTPKKVSKQTPNKSFNGKTAVVVLHDISEKVEPKLGRGKRSKKQKNPRNIEIPSEGAVEEPKESEEPSSCEDSRPHEDSSSASSWDDDGNEDKENVVKYESTLLKKPGNRISLRLRRLPQTSYADKKKVLTQIQGTALPHSDTKLKAKTLLSKAKSRKANRKVMGKKEKMGGGKTCNTEVIAEMMEIDLTGDESEDLNIFPQKKGKFIKKSQVNGKKTNPKVKKEVPVKGKTSLKSKGKNGKKVGSKAIKASKQEIKEVITMKPKRKAAVNARQALQECEVVEVLEKTVKGHKKKESKGQSQTGKTKLAPIFMKKDSEETVEILKVISPTKLKARHEFLMSGLPTEVKLQITAEKSREVTYGPLFPEISHVQQRCDDCEMWNLAVPEIKQLSDSSSTPTITVPHNASIFENKIKVVERSRSVDERPVKLCVNGLSKVLADIKQRHPGVPVFSLFKSYLERKKEKLLQYKKEGEREKQQKCKNDVVLIDLEEEETFSGRKRKKKRRSGAQSKRAKTAGKAQGQQSLDTREGEEGTVTEVEEDPWNERTPYMWTSLFAPRSGQEVIGNKDVVRRVRVWLLDWKRKCEVEARREMKKNKKKSKKDKDDFLTSDESNGFSDEEFGDNALLLTGPSGVGKSALVYALAKELDYKVLEVNASSKRNGKHVISQLSEATQSHRVSNSETTSTPQANTLMSMFASKNSHGETRKLNKGVLELLGEDSSQDSGQDVDKKKSMSLVLFEDIDIVFEDADEGFLSAVQSFMATTKRPIILTTNQASAPVLSKIKGECEHLPLQTTDIPVIALHAQLACLTEGVCPNVRDLLCLASLNCGDIRQTLLDLQLWSQSPQANRKYKEIDKTKLKVDDLLEPAIQHEKVTDLALQDLLPKIPKKKNVVVEYHQGCTVTRTGRHLMLSTLTPTLVSLSLTPEIVRTSLPIITHLPLKVEEEKKKKYPLDPNDPCVKMTRLYERHDWLSLDDESEEEEVSKAQETDKKEAAESESPPPEEVKGSVRKCVDTFSKLYDSLALHDILSAQTPSSSEPKLDNWWWSSSVTAGLSSLPSSASYSGTVQDTMRELQEAMIGHSVTLWNKEVQKAVEGIEGEWKQLHLPVSSNNSVTALMTGKPDVSRIKSSNTLQRSICDKIPVVSRWNHRGFSLEYLPSIRAITRMDELSAVVCEKRRARRFLSHLSQQSIHLNPDDRTTLANVMQI